MTKPRPWLETLLISAASVALLCAPVFASAGGDTHLQGHPSGAAVLTLLFSFVNFFIFVYVINRFARRPFRDFLANRRKTLVEAMSAAARAKEEADAVKAEYEAKAAALEETRRQMVEEIKKLGAKDRERVLEAAREAAERLRENAQRAAESDLQRARSELRAEAARLAAEMATRDIEARLTAEDRRRLVDDFLEAVEQ